MTVIISIVSLVISVIAAFIGVLTYYVTQVKKPKIIVIVEKRIRMGPTRDGGFQLYIPVTFINKAYQTGVVFKINLLIYSKSNSDNVYSIDLARFSEFNDESNSIVDKELPHAIAINGKSSMSKLLRFTWWDYSSPKFVINNPEYTIILNIWTGSGYKPDLKLKHYFSLNEKQIGGLGISNSDSRLVEIPLDRTEPNNRILNKHELSLLK